LNVRMPSLYREMELGYATKLHWNWKEEK
jgi:hypothetical protein